MNELFELFSVQHANVDQMEAELEDLAARRDKELASLLETVEEIRTAIDEIVSVYDV